MRATRCWFVPSDSAASTATVRALTMRMLTPLRLSFTLSILPAALAADWPDLTTGVLNTGEGRADAAVIIAIEDYAKVDDVVGARANADAWLRWFVEGRGIPASRVFKAYDGDATDIQMRALAQKGAASVQAGGTLWFVFIGHGAPSMDGRDGLLIGVDADRSAQGIYQRSVPRQELLTMLDAGPQAQTVAMLDACFSGQTGSGQALVSGLQPLVPTYALAARSPRARVLTAAGSGEFSGPLPGTARPAFSYLALGALQGWADVDGVGNHDGRVSAAEVREYVAGALNITVQGRTQTPSLLGEDGDLGKATAKTAPDLLAIVQRGTSAVGSVDVGGASLADATDFAALAAKAASAKAEREGAETEAIQRAAAATAEEARLKQEMDAKRRIELDRQAAEVRARATRDFTALAPLINSEVTPETQPVIEAFVAQYVKVTVRFDDVEEPVVVAELAIAEAWLGRAVPGKEWVSPTLGTMTWIPAGSFIMGSPEGEPGREMTEFRHPVALTSGYWLMEHEVTQEEWQAVMGSNPSHSADCGPACPVENVRWMDAVEFARQASARDGVTYRLPTEAEWEYAARGAQSYPFAGSRDLSAVADPLIVYSDVFFQFKPHAVCIKARNAYGLCDMSGGVSEFASDWKASYPYIEGGLPPVLTDPTGGSSGAYRVVRGGRGRVAARSGSEPGDRSPDIGFRLARSVSGP